MISTDLGRRWLEDSQEFPGEPRSVWDQHPGSPCLLRLSRAFHVVIVAAPLGHAALSDLAERRSQIGAVAVDLRSRRMGFLVYPSGAGHLGGMVRKAGAVPGGVAYRYVGSGAWFLAPGPRPEPRARVQWLRAPRFADDFTVTVELAKSLVAGAESTREASHPATRRS